MFLEKVMERNPKLLDAAIKLHQQGTLDPDTYILDVPSLLENAKLVLDEAKKHGLNCLYMSKQIGRNAEIAELLEDMGYDGAVAVDYREALHLAAHGLKLWNVGHLVQTPKSVLERLIPYGVRYFTIYSIDKLQEIDEIAKRHDIHQSIMVKVADDSCLIYDGQQGGFNLDELECVVEAAKKLSHIQIEGVTSFPCMLYNEKSKKIEKTANFDLLLKAKERLESLGCAIKEVNTPSSNTYASMQLAADNHATTVEPGHALTGTTPYHAFHSDGEVPTLLYLTEISHMVNGTSYAYGGGYYRRSNLKNALVVHRDGVRERALIHGPSIDSIDYTLKIDGVHPVSATVLCSFRTQIFTTRSHVALIDPRGEEPVLLGVFDAHGYKL
ncbi:MAG: alanine racemase [Erysipelotrichaceae bacterium]|nr:alanine racemase [Erysipelotrichaceae bacterium]